tara:strand:- start:427 stop:900 length:474 start_codon:yes stop_codon:yes gene_type:complete
MKKEYLNIYNNLIKLTRNKSLFLTTRINDTFSERLIIFLIHFAFFLREMKNSENKDILQDIYDLTFKQIDTSIREIGYGDMSINKKMKNYINLFHSIITKIKDWDTMQFHQKSSFLKELINKDADFQFFVNYIENYRSFLKNNTLNSLSKDIIDLKI